jgi:hypothetical protein
MRTTLKLNRGGAITAIAPLCQFRYKRTRKNSPAGVFFLDWVQNHLRKAQFPGSTDSPLVSGFLYGEQAFVVSGLLW